MTKIGKAIHQENTFTKSGASGLNPQIATQKIIKKIIILVAYLPRYRHAIQTLARILREEHTGKPFRIDRHGSQHIRQAVGLVLRLGIRLPCGYVVLH